LFACLAALQGGQAGGAPQSPGGGCWALWSRKRRSRLSAPWGTCWPGPVATAARYNRARSRRRWARQRSLWPGSLTTGPCPTPCRWRRCHNSVARWDASVQHFGLPGVRMDRPARLFLCARCRTQVVLCSHCDRGQRYCTAACSRQARDAAQRDAAQRYQRSRRGRLAHAARTRRWRSLRLACRGGAN